MSAADFELINPAAERGALVVTANSRAARRLLHAYARRQPDSAVWETPAVLSWQAWLNQLWSEYILLPRAPHLRLLSPFQEQVAWERVIAGGSSLPNGIGIASIASLARQAWQLTHAYRLDEPAGALSSDVAQFRRWSRAYRDWCTASHTTDSARLPDLIRAAFDEADLAPPRAFVFVGFDQFTPQQQALVDALRRLGSAVDVVVSPASDVQRDVCSVRLPDATTEMRAAAIWARERMETNPAARIGVVVPDLRSRRAKLQRILLEELHPELLDDLVPGAPRAFDLSLGTALSEYPLISSAFQILRWAAGPMPIEDASSLVRSPFLDGAAAEASARALLDVRVRRKCKVEVSADEVRRIALDHAEHRCPLLAHSLAKLQHAFSAPSALPSAWCKAFTSALSAVGWPGERALNSVEYQTYEKWFELLREFGSLDSATGALSAAGALLRLEQCARDAQFQVQNTAAPLQVLGALEAAGSHFDHLWVMGLDDQSWPPRGRANPFIPISVQRQHNLPHSSPEADLQFGKTILERLLASGEQVVLSWPAHDGESVLRPTPLLEDYPARHIEDVVEDRTPWLATFATELEPLPDEPCVPVPAEDLQAGGTTIFKLQAACPFRAFGKLRLRADAPDSPEPGLDAAERGDIVHRVLYAVWTEIQSHARLLALSPDERRAIIDRNVTREVIRLVGDSTSWSRRFAELERRRVTDLVLAWLDVEQLRAPFHIITTEKDLFTEFGGVRLKVRVDRVDELESGGRVILDYKTGLLPSKAWEGTRPDEPQLPIYAATLPENLTAIAFAAVTTQPAFKGVAARDKVLPAMKASRDPLPGMVEGWREVLVRLGEDFAAGRIFVDPKKRGETCRLCDLKPLCRLAEQPAFAVDGQNGDE